MSTENSEQTRRRGRPADRARRVEAELRERIQARSLRPGELLPPERDLAKSLGVSRMTLRSALAPLEAEGLIERVQGKGTFVSGAHARGDLAVLLNWIELGEDDAYAKQLLHGMHSALQGSGVASTVHGKPAEQSVMEFIREHEALARTWGGLLTYSHFLDREALGWLAHAGIPVVGLAEPNHGIAMSYVDIDNEAGGALAMQHLVEQGFTRPLIIDGGPGSPFAAARARGIRRVLTRHGLAHAHVVCLAEPIHGATAQASAEQAVAPFLARRAIDSVIVYMERPTIGVYRAIERHSLRVGADVAVVHYNDFPWLCDVLRPQPTAIRQPFEQVARDATHMLGQQMRDRTGAIEARVITPVLMVRESTPARER
jgi:DNA-binding LacI/PurR family transcriptional regulator